MVQQAVSMTPSAMRDPGDVVLWIFHLNLLLVIPRGKDSDSGMEYL